MAVSSNVGPTHLMYLAFETDFFNLDQILHLGALRVAAKEKSSVVHDCIFKCSTQINKLTRCRKYIIICTKYLNGREIRIDLMVKV